MYGLLLATIDSLSIILNFPSLGMESFLSDKYTETALNQKSALLENQHLYHTCQDEMCSIVQCKSTIY